MLWTAASAASLLLLAASTASSALVAPSQAPLDGYREVASSGPAATPSRKLHGRFLHITDLHPDPYYVEGSDPDEKCHRGKGDAGYFGAETTSCDAPWSLVDETLKWVDENLKDQIDFVIWTGDSARHDNDDLLPRNPGQVYALNTNTTARMLKVFEAEPGEISRDPNGRLSIPVVPTLGNNDIYPHNIMEPGPNRITKEYLQIWDRFIPEDQFHTFAQGAYFWQQVLPGDHGYWGLGDTGGLAVVSLNSLYFFDSNTAVDGCDSPSEPGYQQLEWLDVQLGLMRERGMKAILIGHIPPAWTSTKQSWDETCWKKYVLWSEQYRDVIVGHIYGHMNLDHFIMLDSHKGRQPRDGKKLKHRKKKKNLRKGKQSVISTIEHYFFPSDPEIEDDACGVEEFDPEADPVFSVSSASDYLQSLRQDFAQLPNVSNKNDEDVANKIGGEWAERFMVAHVGPSVIPNYLPTLRVFEYNTTGLFDGVATHHVDYHTADVGIEKKKKKDPKAKLPDGPLKTTPPGPAYSNQAYTWLGYTQYSFNMTNHAQNSDAGVKYEVEYNTRTDDVYKLKDLTVRSYLEHASRIAGESSSKSASEEIDAAKKKKKKNKKYGKKPKKSDRVWLTFLKRAFIGTVQPESVVELIEDSEERLSAAGCESGVIPAAGNMEDLGLEL